MVKDSIVDLLQSQLTRKRQQSTLAPGTTLFCDFDGPIIDVSDRYYSTYQLALADTQATYQAQGITLPLQVLSKKQFWHMKQNRVPDTEIATQSGLSGPPTETFLAHVRQIVNQPALLHQDHLQPGVRWALNLLRARGIRLVLVTLRGQKQATQILHQYELAHLFSNIRGTTDDQAAYCNSVDCKTQLLAEVMAEHPQQELQSGSAWMIGDTEADILSGQALGIPTIGLTCGIRSKSYLQKLKPTQVHTDLLAVAHHLLCGHHFSESWSH
ncbi:MAG: HAD family hydrolase [Cyanothece sp. SIO1E1]|nr:HAD family hydrolase [Cyanothece sp. SIO1E1]